MSDEYKDSKAQKIAAGKKMLKEYQKKVAAEAAKNASGSSNISEKSSSELSLNGHSNTEDVTNITPASTQIQVNINDVFSPTSKPIPTEFTEAVPNVASYFDNATAIPDSFSAISSIPATALEQQNETQNLNAIQLLITEKSQLTTDLNKYKTTCREKDLELEELRVQLNNYQKRQEELQKRVLQEHQTAEKLEHRNAELLHKLSQINAGHEEQAVHLDELKRQTAVVQAQNVELQQQFKDKCNELEMAQLRIRQLSDEANVSKDNRVETLTQTQFMYEQQIRDLQAMVQQLTQDKDQSNLQYQNYVTHLNTEVSNLNEKNSELLDECTKLQERERQLVEHISGLEREIQKNISRQQEQLRMEKEQENSQTVQHEKSNEIEKLNEKLNEKINDFDFERHEFQLKIKSQEDRLEKLTTDLNQKQSEIEHLNEYIERFNADQPDQTKLLATMESDKVAASRALTQNIELKKQLDELEMRFVQLTNDKAELMQKLDAEEYANREMRTNYGTIEERLRTADERFKFKDEEMIRLSHENMELTGKNVMLQKQLEYMQQYGVKHVAKKSHINYDNNTYNQNKEIHDHEHNHHDQVNECEHEHNHIHDHQHSHSHDDTLEHEHNNEHSSMLHADAKEYCHSESDSCHEAKDDNENPHVHAYNEYEQVYTDDGSDTPIIPTEEAVEKLQHRFTQLMSQVADLTDEKQRLEHLVLQLQGETETIGEYITLYQNQRRILKQREYEKAAQMKLLQTEREQLHERITKLNSLVSSLNIEFQTSMPMSEHLSAALAESISIENSKEDANIATANSTNATPINITQNSKEIIHKIQNIIEDIKENTKDVPLIATPQTVDHLNCCLGKFEVV